MMISNKLIALSLSVIASAGCVGSETESKEKPVTAIVQPAPSLAGLQPTAIHPPVAVQLPEEPTIRELLDQHLVISSFYPQCGLVLNYGKPQRSVWALVDVAQPYYRPIDDLIADHRSIPSTRYYTFRLQPIETALADTPFPKLSLSAGPSSK